MGLLDPVTRRRVAAVLLVAVVAVVALAARDVGPFADPPTEEERAASVVARFFDAAAEGDFSAFCELLTQDARESIEVRAAAIASNLGVTRCDDILDAIARKELADSEAAITGVSVSGPRARVEVKLKLSGEPGAQQRTLLLDETRGDWMISDSGFG
jgi:hypothetical protein